MTTSHSEKIMQIPTKTALLTGALAVPVQSQGLVVFAHGSGSSRLSPRNNFVAEVLRRAGLGTLLLDLLTEKEDATYARRFDIDLLVERLLETTQWLQQQMQAGLAQGTALGSDLRIGYFGASTGA